MWTRLRISENCSKQGGNPLLLYRGNIVDARSDAKQNGGVAVPIVLFLSAYLMRPPSFFPSNAGGAFFQHGPALIAAGLSVLIAAAWWPAAPVITALALVILGATAATILRLAHRRVFCPVIALHLLVYASLYFLFIGAVWHATAAGQRPAWHLWQSLDLAASVGPMALAARWTVASIIAHARGKDATSG